MEKTNEIAKQDVAPAEIIHNLVIYGDLSKMSADQKVEYYNRFCNSLGLNPLTQPFQLISFQQKLRLYATKDCTEQLRKIHGVSITDVTAIELRGVYVVTAKARDKTGKLDAATGVVSIENLKGEALANALMKAETKAKRRVTLSICGLGILDESETDSIGQHTIQTVAEVMAEQLQDMSGEVQEAPRQKRTNDLTRVELANSNYDANQPVVVGPVSIAEVDAITINQKSQILLLLNNSKITKDEKERMVSKIATFDKERASQAIEKLKKVIKERSGTQTPVTPA